jgi:hypothetical protein
LPFHNHKRGIATRSLPQVYYNFMRRRYATLAVIYFLLQLFRLIRPGKAKGGRTWIETILEIYYWHDGRVVGVAGRLAHHAKICCCSCQAGQ